MLKLIIALFNLLALIVITALLPADIKVETTLPEEFVVDSTYVIEVKITKGSIFGFAKYQQNLPPGFEVQPGRTSEGSFTYADGKVKFIWMALPESNEVRISYTIRATSSAPASGVIEGTFSYIEDNERKTYPIPNIPIKVVAEKVVAVARVPLEIDVSRDVTALGNNEFEVTLTVKKQGIEGFAKVEEFLPDGAEATVITNNKAVFSQVNEKVKFVWMAIPAEQNLTVAYNVKAQRDITNELMAMDGSFSYLEDQETKSVAVRTPVMATVASRAVADAPKPTPVAVVNEVAVVEPPKPVPAPVVVTEPAKPTPAPTVAQQPYPVKTAAKPTPQPERTAAQPAKAKTVVPTPETGITYKVQIVAGHVLVNEAYIQKRFNFTDNYTVENHEGWIKYTTGGFPVYKEARDKRESLIAAQHNFPGPFVTAYNSGVRITVQEALMISNQKWVK